VHARLTVTANTSIDRGPLGCPTVLDWLDQPCAHSGLYFAQTGEDWLFLSYEQLATKVRQAAWRLRRAGVASGDVVVLVCPTSPDFVAGFFGTLMCGATPSPLATPLAFADRVAYLDHLARGTRLVRARAVFTTPDLDATLRSAALGCAVLSGAEAVDPELSEVVPPPATGLIQFSSGSTGPQRAIKISYPALNANIRAMHRWLGYRRHDALATWLPLHHDMGLVSSLLGPIINQSDLWLMTPEQFVRSPLRWLRCHATAGATTSACPPFGLAHVVRRVSPKHLAGLDFSGWRSLVTGAERVDPAVVHSFIDLLAPFGFRSEAVVPAYGLAEATLAVTGARPDEPFRCVSVDPDSLRIGGRVRLATAAGRLLPLTDCGVSLPGMRVAILDDHGAPVMPGVLGEVAVRGASLASGYLTDGGEHHFGTTVRTGDAGFLLDGRLFVAGRIGDSVKLRGRWLFAEDLDRVAVQISPRPRKTVVLLGDASGSVTVVVAVEGGAGDMTGALGRAITECATGARVQVLAVPTGWIAVTTSGKVRRREMWRRLQEGGWEIAVTWDSQRDGLGVG
jgi:acyl-CoA synthetase (AMP-forming)/AMP-acid ligase II